MKIAIDATALRGDRLTGIERYTDSLVRSLLPRAGQHEMHILLREGYRPAEWQLGYTTKLHAIPGRNRLARDQVWIPRKVRLLRPDVVHFPAFPPPVGLLGAQRVVVTIHDAVYWRYRHTVSRGTRYYYGPSLAFTLKAKRCDAVSTVSAAAADDLREVVPSGIPVSVIPPGVGPEFRAASPTEAARGRGGYLLAVGTREPRKNLNLLLAAYERLVAMGRTGLRLVVVGRVGWGPEASRAEAGRGGVVVRDRVSDAELSRLYRGCAVFVMPSLYEGFGLPLLEAMASGAPCIASAIPALQEVGGSACMYVSPHDARQVAAAIATLLDQPDRRYHLAQAGIERSRAFSWSACAEKTLALYEGLPG